MAGFSVAIGSDTRIFEQGVRTGVIEPVEDAQEALQDLARSGDRAGDSARDLERVGKAADHVEDSARDAERAVRRLGDSGEDATDDVADGAKKAERQLDRLGNAGKEAGDDLEHSLRDAQQQTGKTAAEYKEMAEKIRAETAKIKASSQEGFEGAGHSTGEFREEAIANFSEVSSSFTGDMSSITDLAQGTFGGLAALGGPAGLAFGAIAVGVGLVGTALQGADGDTEAFKERVDSATSEILDRFYETGDAVSVVDDQLRQWAQDSTRMGVSLTDLQKDLKGTRLGFADMATTLAGGTLKELRNAKKATDDQIDSLRKVADISGRVTDAQIKDAGAASDKAARLKSDLLPAIDQQIQASENAKLAEEALAGAQGMTVAQYQAYIEKTNAAKEANEQFAESVTGALTDAAQTTGELLDNAAANPADYIAGMQARVKAVQDYQANVQAIGQELPDDLFGWVRSQGTDFSQEIATYLAASPEQKAAIRESWAIEAQVTADTSDVDKKTDAKSKEKKAGPTSEVKGDTKDLDKKVDEKSKQKADGPTLKLRADDSDVDKALAAMRDKRFNGPTAVFQVDRSSVNAAISDLRQTQINIKVKAVDG